MRFFAHYLAPFRTILDVSVSLTNLLLHLSKHLLFSMIDHDSTATKKIPDRKIHFLITAGLCVFQFMSIVL